MKKLRPDVRAKFLEGKRRYYEEYFRAHGHHPKKGRHPPTEYKKGNRVWVGRHHTDETKAKIALALTGLRESAETRRKKSLAHMGKIPWNKGLTQETSPTLARIGDKVRAWWTPERRKEFAKWGTEYLKEWWRNHPDSGYRIPSIARRTKIERFARRSVSKRGIPFVVNKKLEGVCFPDLILPALRIVIFCNGCFWHACPQHNPISSRVA